MSAEPVTAPEQDLAPDAERPWRARRAEEFPDLTDAILFPRFSEQKLAKLGQSGERRSFATGEFLFEQGLRDAPFFVIEQGAVDFLERRPDGDIWFSRAEAGMFIGDTAMFTGEPTIARCLASEPTEVIAFERPALRAMLAEWPEFGEVVLRALTARRAWLEGHEHGVMRLIASRDSRRGFQVRDLIERNLLPLRFYDTDTDADSAGLLEALNIPSHETPVLIRNDGILRNPSPAQVARDLGLRAELDGKTVDVAVLGGGPAGLAAAVYGGSEGLTTAVIEAWAPGGQAGTSSRIENYLGFPTGISGAELTRKATLQARRFDAILSSFHRVEELVEGHDGLLRIDLDDGQHLLARTVIVATGARWRELDAADISRFWGAGVYHAVSAGDAQRCAGEDVIIVGGGNSAGQAAVFLSRRARSVRLVVRRSGLEQTMSRYLVERLERAANVELVGETELTACHGERGLEAVTLRDRRDGAERRLDVDAVFVMIGADPCTEPLAEMVGLDDRGFVVCGDDARDHQGPRRWTESGRDPLLLETVRAGVFAAGDVRAGSTKRVASAVGDGALVVRFAHEVLAG